jgi:hypothetical protein
MPVTQAAAMLQLPHHDTGVHTDLPREGLNAGGI